MSDYGDRVRFHNPLDTPPPGVVSADPPVVRWAPLDENGNPGPWTDLTGVAWVTNTEPIVQSVDPGRFRVFPAGAGLWASTGTLDLGIRTSGRKRARRRAVRTIARAFGIPLALREESRRGCPAKAAHRRKYQRRR